MKHLYFHILCGLFIAAGLPLAAQPANDNVCNAIALPVNGSTGNYDNFGSTTQPGENDNIRPPLGDGAGNYAWYEDSITHSVWFTFVAPPSGSVNIDLCNGGVGTTFDTQVAVYEVGNCSDFTTFRFIGGNDDVDGGCPAPANVYASVVDVICLSPGTTYYVLVDGWLSLPTSADTTGTFSITLTELPGTGAALALDFAVRQPVCAGELGAIAAVGSGGGQPYSYSWSNGATTQTLAGLPAGDYIATLTDQCDSVLVDTVTIAPVSTTNPTLVSMAGDDAAICNGSSIQLNGSAAGGVPKSGPTAYGVAATSAVVNFRLRAPGAATSIGSTTATQVYAGDFAFGTFFGISNNTDQLVAIDIASGATVIIGPAGKPTTHTWTGLAFNAAENVMYGISTSGTASLLYTLDLSLGTATSIASISGMTLPIWLAIDNNGLAYSLDLLDDNLYRLDLTTGVATEIGPTGFNANFAQDADFDPETNILYMGAFTNGFTATVLRQVDVATGYSFEIGPITGSGNMSALAIAENNVQPYDYSWSPPLALSPTPPLVPNPVAEPPITTSYILSVVDECGTLARDTITINVGDPAALDLSSTPINTTTSTDGTATATLTGGTAPFSYLWSTGDTTSSITVTTSGSYSVVVTDAAGCTVEGSVEVGDATAIDPLLAAGIGSLSIYPNPTSGRFLVELETRGSRETELSVFDTRGALLYQTHKAGLAWKHSVDLSRQPAGIYMLRLTTEEGSVMRRIVLQ
ncbi:MAG: hypothetical protein OHK0039_27600 [Bacteroidia bacterium]